VSADDGAPARRGGFARGLAVGCGASALIALGLALIAALGLGRGLLQVLELGVELIFRLWH
jgi:hypothetical protein